MGRIIRRARFDVIEPGQVVVTISPEPFLFPTGHPNRGVDCLICQTAIGGHPTVLVTIAVVSADICHCGGVVSETFVMHSMHGHPELAEMQAALGRGLQCPEFHDS